MSEEAVQVLGAIRQDLAHVLHWYWQFSLDPVEAAFCRSVQVCGIGFLGEPPDHDVVVGFRWSSRELYWRFPYSLLAQGGPLLMSARLSADLGSGLVSEPDEEGLCWLGQI